MGILDRKPNGVLYWGYSDTKRRCSVEKER